MTHHKENGLNTEFTQGLIAWQKTSGRHHLPWQSQNVYHIWLSEMMLQQTQVSTVCDYFVRFIQRFPTMEDLANADIDDVFALWAGLGYYRRAQFVHQAAKIMVHQWKKQFPHERKQWETLPGIGRSTAAAIVAFAFRQPETILDGNVQRVLCRVFALDGDLIQPAFIQQLWQFAERLLPENTRDIPAYIQGLMDLGATICTKNPHCEQCPQQKICLAKQQNRILELPHKSNKIQVKKQELFWALCVDKQNRILLVKRPHHGIWANLFCLPCFENEQAYQDFIDEHHLIETQELPSCQHRLTHRLLNIRTQVFRLPEKPSAFANGFWISFENLSDYAKPKPLDRLLMDFYAQSHPSASKKRQDK